jgi:hypothetical protein
MHLYSTFILTKMETHSSPTRQETRLRQPTEADRPSELSGLRKRRRKRRRRGRRRGRKRRRRRRRRKRRRRPKKKEEEGKEENIPPFSASFPERKAGASRHTEARTGEEKEAGPSRLPSHAGLTGASAAHSTHAATETRLAGAPRDAPRRRRRRLAPV